MPIYEYYCPQNHTIYQFLAKTLTQGQRIPKCPDNPAYRMTKMVSTFAITKGDKPRETGGPEARSGDAVDDPRMEAALGAMEREFSQVDENDPRAMARMMRRMSDLTGERLQGDMEEVVRKLEEGADPESLEEQLGSPEAGDEGDDFQGAGAPAGMSSRSDIQERRHRWRALARPPRRDPNLYDYD
ncbi:MAG: FmdB family transcriptional regulator [Cephaloticoccus sp.]|nr:FmdB family transcriptional regulator [Cephaloticoccus sp.]MCF7759895.1 FmdB family transcriptional regulator [Cephaloticoccus sp.]